MRKLFEEYGTVIVVVIAVVALFSVVIALAQPGGPIGTALGNIANAFVQKSDDMLNRYVTAPTLTLNREFSQDGASPTIVGNSSLTVSGVATDDTGVASLTVADSAVTVNADGSWSTVLELNSNTTTELVITATDVKGNTTSLTIYVEYAVYVDFKIEARTRDYVGYTGEEDEVLVIPETFKRGNTWYRVTGIDFNAFEDCDNLLSVTMPDTITSMGQYAFRRCTNLEEIVLSKNLSAIADYAFYDCSSLKKIVIPDGVEQIGVRSFYNCRNLFSIVIPVSVTKFMGSSFVNCESLANIYYRGTASQWSQVTLGATWNQGAGACVVTYNYVG